MKLLARLEDRTGVVGAELIIKIKHTLCQLLRGNNNNNNNNNNTVISDWNFVKHFINGLCLLYK
jgi:hypothetical protein